MIPCQRHLFTLPDHITYLNCAYTAPLLRCAADAGEAAITTKRHPWRLSPRDFFSDSETVREMFARLVGGRADDVAIIPAVSYGIGLAAKNLPLNAGEAIVMLQDQFPSNVYAWQRLAAERNARIHTVARPSDDDWSASVLEAIDERTAIAALPHCHWTDGTLLDLVRIAAKCRSVGAALVVDGTQSLGAMPFSVAEVQPDFLVTTAHKWLLGPYSFGFCHIAAKWHGGIPLEENWLNRAGSEDFSRLVAYCDAYQAGARRFDMGAMSNFIATPIAGAALRQLLEWSVEGIAATLRVKTDWIARRARALGFAVAPDDARAPHMIGLTAKEGLDAALPQRLAQQNIFVSLRGRSIRISPHLYNSDADLERLGAVLESVA